MASDKLQILALWAEIVSAAAIIITIAFLAIEMRANTNAILGQTYQNLTEQLNTYRTDFIQIGGVDLRVKLNKVGWANLSKTELDTIRMIRLNLYGIYENAFYAQQKGVIGANEWTRFEYNVCLNYKGDKKRGLWITEGGFVPIRELLTPTFVEYIESSCD